MIFIYPPNIINSFLHVGEFTYYLCDYDGHAAGDLDESKLVLTYGKRAGILTRDGSKWVVQKSKGEPLIFNNLDSVLIALEEDPKFLAQLKKATLKVLIADPLGENETDA